MGAMAEDMNFCLPFLAFAIKNACLDSLTWEWASAEGDWVENNSRF